MTELKLEFELENAELPIDYDKVILSFMKSTGYKGLHRVGI